MSRLPRSPSRRRSTAAKIDLCLFLKVFLQEHHEMDQAIRQVQGSPQSLEQLFALLGPDEQRRVAAPQLVEFVRGFAELGRPC